MTTEKLMTKAEMIEWAEAHQDEWFAQTILNCWDDDDFKGIDKEFFESLRDAMNEQYCAAAWDGYY